MGGWLTLTHSAFLVCERRGVFLDMVAQLPRFYLFCTREMEWLPDLVVPSLARQITRLREMLETLASEMGGISHRS